ncbi:MAG: penicillin-binding protein 2 [Acidimicrobiales bacterium]|nr:penicillin-binding protein 2 [Acidimicrobiales bacterium]
MPSPLKSFFRRSIFVACVMILISGGLVWRLVYFQILDSDRYIAHGASQRMKTEKVLAQRGSILDRHGVDLAISVPRNSLIANSKHVEDPVQTAKALIQILGGDLPELENKLNSGKEYVYLFRQVEERFADAVLSLNLSGIFTEKEQSRVRPDGDAVLAIIGRTDIDGNGISGLEKSYNEYLSGTNGVQRIERGPRGSTIPGGEYSVEPAVNGKTIVSTLDRSLQFEAEKILISGVEKAGGESGLLVAMKPSTGEVLASVAVERNPDGELHQITEHRSATWTFEPGSIMKPLTFSAVMDAGVASTDSVRKVADEIHVHDSDFSDWFDHDETEWSVSEILFRSSNVGTILWAQEIGPALLHNKLQKFGIGRKSELNFPGEANGILLPVEKWSGTSLPTIAIGQGVSVTPIQMVTAYATIANRGLKPAPTLISDVGDNVEMPVNALNGQPERIIESRTAESIVEIIETVVSSGTGKNAQVPGYRVAGKTGTAWKPQLGGYGEEEEDRRYVVSFAGFFPVDDPEIVALVVVDEPSGSADSGGRAAAPIFAEFAKFAARQLRIPSENEKVDPSFSERVVALTPAQAGLLTTEFDEFPIEEFPEEIAGSLVE